MEGKYFDILLGYQNAWVFYYEPKVKFIKNGNGTERPFLTKKTRRLNQRNVLKASFHSHFY